MYTALYRAYRPEVFDEILGQDHIVKILRNQIRTDSTSHAYLFCGTRGTGKTTTARILAKGLNCLAEEEGRPCGKCSACMAIKEGTFLDVMEIDAASNNGVDNIRELRESIKYPPAAGRKKVYIIDEVHMLSTGAFNALLKTLEEPPEYVVFILATTEPQKLPATILSRCIRLDFKRVPENILISGMGEICRKQGINVSEAALRIIAANADGSVRDGLSMLDQCTSSGELKVEAKDVLEFLGASGEETFVELTDFVRKGRTADALVLVARVLADGKDVRQFMKDWVNHYRNLLMTKFIKNPQDIINMSVENIDRIRKQSQAIELSDINRGILELSETMNEARWSTQPRILLELVVVKLSSSSALNGASVSLHQEQTMQSEIGNTVCSEKAESVEVFSEPTNEEKNEKGDVSVKIKSRERQESSVEIMDYDAVWKAVFEDGEVAKGSFYIIGSSAKLIGVDENSFTVMAKSEHVRKHAEANRNLLEELMEKHTGKRRTMRIKGTESVQKKSEKDDIGAIADKAGELLGIKVEIE